MSHSPHDTDPVQDPEVPATGPEAPTAPGAEDVPTDAESGHGQKTEERSPGDDT